VSDGAAVRSTLLDLGLEDLIPVPESVATVRKRGSRQPEHDVRDALGVLGREGLVRFWRGPWNREDEHVEVSAHEAARLLEDMRWLCYNLDEADEERLYFINVENIAAED